jgi:hypothetical protein
MVPVMSSFRQKPSMAGALRANAVDGEQSQARIGALHSVGCRNT